MQGATVLYVLVTVDCSGFVGRGSTRLEMATSFFFLVQFNI